MFFVKKLSWAIRLLKSLCINLFLIWPMVSAGPEDKPEIVLPELRHPPSLENFLNMRPEGEIEKQMAQVEGFIQRRPKDGEPSSQHTEVYLGYDKQNLYVVFVAFDEHPDRVRAQLSRRENIFSDDIVEVMLDTFHDERRAYVFVTNPLGVQWDALWTEGEEFDETFDTVWKSEGKLTEQGYVVWMAIPFKSLRFPSMPTQTWGAILLREIQRGTAEQSFWPRVSSRIEGRLNQAATLHIKDEISSGRNIQFIPYATNSTFRILEQRNTSEPKFVTDYADPNIGLDAKYVVGNNLVLDGTLNPDFSQVESDEPQVTVNQRFEVFFPEKRPFFLENAGFFQSPIDLVFTTRRIADPQFGIKLTGKTGPYEIGGFWVDDQAPGKRVAENNPLSGKRAYFGILHFNRDIFQQSNIGITFTDRELEDSFNRVGSIDGRLKLNQNWTSDFQVAFSATKSLSGNTTEGAAYDLQFNSSARKVDTHTHYRNYTPNFQTLSGFVPRVDIHAIHHSLSYRFRPEGEFLIAWGPNLFFERIWDHNGLRLDDTYSGGIVFEGIGQTNLGFFYEVFHERLRPKDFAALEENQDFAPNLTSVFLSTSIIKEISFEGNIFFGNQINFVPPSGRKPWLANSTGINIELNVRPSQKLKNANTYILSMLGDPASDRRIFENQIFRSKWSWQFNRELSLRLLFQYDVTDANENLTNLTTTKNFNADFLVTYLVNPWNALYVGINSNYQNIDLHSNGNMSNIIRTQNQFLNDARQFFIKYSYLFRL